MNYITEAFKALEDVNEGIILEKVENQPVKKVAKKSIVESKQMHYTTRPNAKRSLKESYDEESCIKMIHSIMAYPKKTYENGEDLVASEESNWKDYLKPYKDSLGREKVVELANQQLNRPHHIQKGVMTDSDGLSYNSLIFDESCNESAIQENAYGKDELDLRINNDEGVYNYLYDKVDKCIKNGKSKDATIISIAKEIGRMKNDFNEYGKLYTTQAERYEIAKDFVDTLWEDEKVNESKNVCEETTNTKKYLTPEEAVKVIEDGGKVTVLGHRGYLGCDWYMKGGYLTAYNFEIMEVGGGYYEKRDDFDLLTALKRTVKGGGKLVDTTGITDPEEIRKMHINKSYKEEGLKEDTVKQNGKWVNKGKEGTHGTFKTKKQADAQRKAMFANGYKESLDESALEEAKVNYVDTLTVGKYGTKVKVYYCEGDDITPKGYFGTIGTKEIKADTLDELKSKLNKEVGSQDKQADLSIMNDSYKRADKKSIKESNEERYDREKCDGYTEDDMYKEDTFDEEEQEEYEIDEDGYNEDGYQWHHCGFCGQPYPDDEMRFEMSFGWICDRCEDDLRHHGGHRLYFIESKNRANKKSLKESETINLNDDEEIKKGQEILDKEEDETIEKVVDVDADTVDKLKDSYIGNVILQCPVCRTLIYKKPDMLDKDEETELYNKEDECPHCGSKDGFELVGQVASLEVETEDDTIETTGTDSETEIEKDADLEPVEEPVEKDVEETETKFESLDNKKFDRLVNKYLHNIYENVRKFESNSGKVDDKSGKLVVEGVVYFKDGKSNPTRFVFEQYKNTNMFKGLNEMFSKNKGAFTLKTSVKDKVLVCESFRYNYTTKLNNERVLVKGKFTND